MSEEVDLPKITIPKNLRKIPRYVIDLRWCDRVHYEEEIHGPSDGGDLFGYLLDRIKGIKVLGRLSLYYDYIFRPRTFSSTSEGEIRSRLLLKYGTFELDEIYKMIMEEVEKTLDTNIEDIIDFIGNELESDFIIEIRGRVLEEEEKTIYFMKYL